MQRSHATFVACLCGLHINFEDDWKAKVLLVVVNAGCINVDTTVWPFLSTHHISVQTCGQEQRVWQPCSGHVKETIAKAQDQNESCRIHLCFQKFFFGSWAFTVFELSCGWKIHCATQRRVWSRMKQLDEQKDTLHIFSDTIRSYSFIFIHFSRIVHQKDERNKSLVAHSWQLVQLVQLVMISHVLRNFVSKDCLGGLGTPGPRVNTWMSSLAASNAVLKLENGGKMTVSWTSDVLNKRYQYYINIILTLYQHYIIYQLCQLDSRTSQVFHMSTRSALPIPAEAWMLQSAGGFTCHMFWHVLGHHEDT